MRRASLSGLLVSCTWMIVAATATVARAEDPPAPWVVGGAGDASRAAERDEAGDAAHDAGDAPPLPPPPPRPAPRALPPNVVANPDGTVTVHRTPEGGVDVHAQTRSGTVRATGCSRVTVDPRSPAPPCPSAYPYLPPPPLPAYYYPPAPYPYPYPYGYAPPPRRPQDPARTAALIASSLGFGLGTLAAGTAYLVSLAPYDHDCDVSDTAIGCSSRGGEPSKSALYTMGGIMTFTPSIPRFVVGDVGVGVLLTGLRGGSFAAGAFIEWEDDSYVLPVTFAFVLPLALGVVDLATTPHRMAEPDPQRTSALSLRLEGLGPTATLDREGRLSPALGATGTF